MMIGTCRSDLLVIKIVLGGINDSIIIYRFSFFHFLPGDGVAGGGEGFLSIASRLGFCVSHVTVISICNIDEFL
jgi:hypothetical protein